MGPGSIHRVQYGNTARSWWGERERERERTLQCRPRVSFLLGLRVGVWAEFCVFVTIWQVKLKKENTNGSVV